MCLYKGFELILRFLEQVLAQDQVARFGRFVDQCAAFLVVERPLDVVWQ
jgi:hypothetical protein